MRIATYNVENFFRRAKALGMNGGGDGRAVLEQQARINELLQEPVYTEAIKAEIVQLLIALGLGASDDGGEYVLLRQNRGHLVKRPAGGGVEVVASGRDDWIGWVDLKVEPVDELATRHLAMVVRDVGAEVQAVVEVEDRGTLRDFSTIQLAAAGGTPYDHAMEVDGNDERLINVGILTREPHAISAIRSHVDDTDGEGQIFSRDCVEYQLDVPGQEPLIVLVNHLKSKGFGTQADNDARRHRQAVRVAEIYRGLRDSGHQNIAVVGDFNDYPTSAVLAPLLAETDLKDITTHRAFTADDRPGTYDNATARDKIDYILLAPALYDRVTGGAIFRKGAWGGKHGTLWQHYPTITTAEQAASDHAALYADLDL